MCFSKNDGGIRCDVRPKLKHNRQKLQDAEKRLVDIKTAIASIDKSNPQARFNGKLRRKVSLENESHRIKNRVAILRNEVKAIQRHWEISSKGISELQDRAEDSNLTLEQRKHYEALAKLKKKERGEKLKALDIKRLSERNLPDIMTKDGFDQATIDECNIPISINKYARTPKVYKKRIHSAVNAMQALEVQRMEALRTCKPEKRLEVEARYASKLATENIKRLEAQYGYESTIEGIASLKDEAEDRSIRMTQTQRQTLVERYHKAVERHEGEKRDRNNRDNRRNAIKRAYKEKGLDATKALNAHELVTKSTVNKSGSIGSTATNMSIRRTVLLTASESARVEADFRASGASSLSAYVRTKIMGAPTVNIQDKPLRKLNQEADLFSDGGRHRQKTSRAGRRNAPSDTKLNAQEDEKVTARAKAFHMSKSSWMRAMLLGIDPRQIQNDRSDETNDIKTAMMEDLQRKSA